MYFFKRKDNYTFILLEKEKPKRKLQWGFYPIIPIWKIRMFIFKPRERKNKKKKILSKFVKFLILQE